MNNANASEWLKVPYNKLPQIKAIPEDAPAELELAIQLVARAAEPDHSRDLVSDGHTQINAGLQTVDLLQTYVDHLRVQYTAVKDEQIEWLKNELTHLEKGHNPEDSPELAKIQNNETHT